MFKLTNKVRDTKILSQRNSQKCCLIGLMILLSNFSYKLADIVFLRGFQSDLRKDTNKLPTSIIEWSFVWFEVLRPSQQLWSYQDCILNGLKEGSSILELSR